jgi:hypothetical protein
MAFLSKKNFVLRSADDAAKIEKLLINCSGSPRLKVKFAQVLLNRCSAVDDDIKSLYQQRKFQSCVNWVEMLFEKWLKISSRFLSYFNERESLYMKGCLNKQLVESSCTTEVHVKRDIPVEKQGSDLKSSSVEVEAKVPVPTTTCLVQQASGSFISNKPADQQATSSSPPSVETAGKKTDTEVETSSQKSESVSESKVQVKRDASDVNVVKPNSPIINFDETSPQNEKASTKRYFAVRTLNQNTKVETSKLKQPLPSEERDLAAKFTDAEETAPKRFFAIRTKTQTALTTDIEKQHSTLKEQELEKKADKPSIKSTSTVPKAFFNAVSALQAPPIFEKKTMKRKSDVSGDENNNNSTRCSASKVKKIEVEDNSLQEIHTKKESGGTKTPEEDGDESEDELWVQAQNRIKARKKRIRSN